jgi:sigma-B regulation protein RsbU (phosphoserine phosphatase)
MGLVLEADRELTAHRPLEEIFDAVIDLARRAVGCDRAALMLLDGDRLVQRAVLAPAAEAARPIAISSTIVDRVLFLREALLIRDAQEEAPYRGRRSLVDAQVRSVMCAPLRDENRVIGLLYVDSRRDAGLYTEDDLRVLAHLASVAAVRIENTRLFWEAVRIRTLEEDLRQAADIQDGLLPADFPAIAGYEVQGRSVPCRSVGGDCFDFLALPDGRQVIQLGDVAGKGLPAALLMCCFHATLRAVASAHRDPAGTIRELNRLLHPRFPPNRFVTCFYGVLDPTTHRLTYINAGQDTPFVIPARGEPRALPGSGLPLGLVEDAEYQSGDVDLGPGDILLCYSDGATEGVNPHGEMFGTGRLVTTAAMARERPAREIVAALTRAIEAHHAGGAHEDDITLLVVKRSG